MKKLLYLHLFLLLIGVGVFLSCSQKLPSRYDLISYFAKEYKKFEPPKQSSQNIKEGGMAMADLIKAHIYNSNLKTASLNLKLDSPMPCNLYLQLDFPDRIWFKAVIDKSGGAFIEVIRVKGKAILRACNSSGKKTERVINKRQFNYLLNETLPFGRFFMNKEFKFQKLSDGYFYKKKCSRLLFRSDKGFMVLFINKKTNLLEGAFQSNPFLVVSFRDYFISKKASFPRKILIINTRTMQTVDILKCEINEICNENLFLIPKKIGK